MSSGQQNTPSKLDLTIVYAEDERASRERTAEYLSRCVKNVLVASDGEQAYALVLQGGVDVVLSDIKMPNVTGLQLAEKLKSSHPELPIILVSAYTDMDYLLSAIELGVHLFLIKPVNVNRLFETLAKIERQKKERLQALEKAFLLQEYMKAIDSSFIVSKTDRNGTITFVNDRFCEISGYSKEELIGNKHNIVNHTIMPKPFFKNMWETLLACHTWRGRMTNRKKDGGFYIVDSTIIPICNAQGEILEFISIRQDITELMVQRKLLAKEKQELENVKSSYEEKIAKTKDSLLSVFTHELRTPLNAIVNFTGIVSRDLAQRQMDRREELLEYLDIVSDSSTQMLDMVNGILQIVKLRTEEIALKKEKFSICDFLEELIENRFSATKKSVVLECALEYMFETDKSYLDKIATELITNALKYSKSKVVAKGFKNELGFGFTIEDDGKGIRDKEGAFGLFCQNDESYLTRESRGVGVGLHLVKQYADLLGLQITIDDSPLGGALVAVLQPVSCELL